MLRSSLWSVAVKLAALLFWGVVGHAAAFAQSAPIELHAEQNVWKISADQFVLSADIPETASIADVLSGDYESAFAAPEQSVPNFSGYDQTVWGRLRITNPESRSSRVSLAVKYPQLDRVYWYIVDEAKQVETASAGQFLPRDREQLANRFPSVSIELPPGASKDVYFKIRSDTVVILPLRLYRTSYWISRSSIELLMFGLLIGCLATMTVLGLISFYGSKHWSSLWFAVFCTASAGYVLTASGLDKAYLWPNRTGDFLFMLFVFQGIAMMATALFVDRFLRTKTKAPWLFRLLRVQAGFALMTCFTSVFPMWLATLSFLITIALGPPIILAGVLFLWYRRAPGAGLVVLSWIPNQIGAFWIFLRAMDVVPYTDINHYTLPVFCTLTAIAFIWALHRQNAESAHRATHDMLTGLPNRFGFEQTVARTTKQRGRPLAIMQIDLDGFKGVNDTYGHAAGDFVLQQVSARLRDVCAPDAVPFRNGGDEFIILCVKRTRQSDVEALASAIIERLAEPMMWRGRTVKIGASVGVAFPMSGGGPISSALEQADAALYTAKQKGKGCLVVANAPVSEPGHGAVAA